MRTHHRNYPYRPPRRVHPQGARALIRRFLRDYVSPYRWRVAMVALLVGANACSVYLIAFYGRIVVDTILAVEPAPPPPAAPEGFTRTWRGEPAGTGPTREAAGLAARLAAAAPAARGPEAGRKLAAMFVIYLSSLVGLNFLERFAQTQTIRIGRTLAARLREDLHAKVMELSLRFHQTTTPGRLLSRITSDVDVAQRQAMQAIVIASRSLLMLALGLGILLATDVWIGLFFFCVAPLYGLVYYRYRGRIRESNRELRHTNSCLYGFVTQKIEAIKAVQAYVREGLERLHMHQLAACFLRDATGQQASVAGMQTWARIISGSLSSLIFAYAAYQVTQGRMTLGQLLFVHAAVGNLFMPVIEISQLNVILSNLQVVLARMMSILDAPVEICNAPDARPMPVPLRTGLSVRNLTFSYGDGADVPPVLSNISLDVPAGTWLCLMGPSGAGKSTLLFLLARLYEPVRGTISYDDVPLPKIALESLRTTIGVVPQIPQVFSGTVRDNICYGKPEASPTQIMRAARMAEMHDFIMALPVQYETIVGERGASLSGGQRQRLALARALLTDPQILLLDDCTSALDANTERKIQDTLTHTLAGKTAVIASQRVSMARRCHRIAVLENGVVSEFGTHDELIRLGGFYARLDAQQSAAAPRPASPGRQD
ncbi:MAG: putative multidrug export ATP-binding/permease protein [Lentisphaerae bacterium ADurb.BinA184]|nr:MAG: putative multidrug export ATP-binding/permease protein [Lentisphaerae bacterium ADurb.BinA184]